MGLKLGHGGERNIAFKLYFGDLQRPVPCTQGRQSAQIQQNYLELGRSSITTAVSPLERMGVGRNYFLKPDQFSN